MKNGKGKGIYKTFKQPAPLTEAGRKAKNRCQRLMAQARRGDKEALIALNEEFGMKVYTPREIKTFVADRPDLMHNEVIGHQYFDATAPNF